MANEEVAKKAQVIGASDMFASYERSISVNKSASGNGSAETTTVKYYGDYNTLKTGLSTYSYGCNPPDGSGITGRVLSANLTRQEGGEMAELVVVYGEIPVDSSLTTNPYSEDVEVTCAELSQPLAFHENFPKDEDIVKEWSLFLASPPKIQAQGKYLVDPDDPNSAQRGCGSSLSPWVELYNKGISSFTAYQPVVSRNTTSTTKPIGVGAKIGKRDTPPSINGMAEFSGLQWLKTGDTVRKNYAKSQDGETSETYTRTEQWTGAAEWSETLYPSGN